MAWELPGPDAVKKQRKELKAEHLCMGKQVCVPCMQAASGTTSGCRDFLRGLKSLCFSVPNLHCTRV